MKKVTLILGFFVVSFGALAQEKSEVKQSDFQGPAYKNFQAWMHKAVPTKIYSASNVKSLKGPAYKNYQPERDTSKLDLVLVSTVGNEQHNLKGPAYKNYNPWNKKEN